MTEKKRSPENTTSRGAKTGLLAEALIMGGDGLIERQEAAGQQDLVNSDTLPTDLGYRQGNRPNVIGILEAAGVKFLGVVQDDPIFQFVELPAGWKKVPTDHSMWSKLVDDKGRERAMIFYKAAFYDRHAHLRLSTRFSVSRDYKREKSEGVVVINVLDSGVVAHSTEPVKLPADESKKYDVVGAEEAKAEEWLKANYPDYRNPGAYWD